MQTAHKSYINSRDFNLVQALSHDGQTINEGFDSVWENFHYEYIQGSQTSLT